MGLPGAGKTTLPTARGRPNLGCGVAGQRHRIAHATGWSRVLSVEGESREPQRIDEGNIFGGPAALERSIEELVRGDCRKPDIARLFASRPKG
ncbi:MAG TPA: hypothetical protein VNF99_04505 [Stellaceae bacterium]|nr:hypothetical protein [Stellaceae bacterium]